MINFQTHTLSNGLRLILHQDLSTPLVAVNTLYRVGAKDEEVKRTGFAHLFEHLMFGGSKHIAQFDAPLQMASGENNAFTNNDITNYYITLPKENLEIALWLESDRMLELDFSQKSLEVQKNVVIEEFKQRYLNQPYGDVWLKLRPLAYKIHPYRWPTIGKEIQHISDAELKDVEAFFYTYYRPNNAILSIAGNIDIAKTIDLVEKWYSDIPSGVPQSKSIPPEPKQTEKRVLHHSADVPLNAIYKVFHMCSRTHKDYHATDFVSDVLSLGKSSRFQASLIREQGLFSSIDAYILGSDDPGLFVVSGKLQPGVSFEKAEEAIDKELDQLKTKHIHPNELKRVKNKAQSSFAFSSLELLNRAMNLALFEHLGDAQNLNLELEKYAAVQIEDISRVAQELFRDENSSVLYYAKNKKQ